MSSALSELYETFSTRLPNAVERSGAIAKMVADAAEKWKKETGEEWLKKEFTKNTYQNYSSIRK